MRKVLVTGATGFIGSHLVRHLNEKNIAVYILRNPQSSLKHLEGTRFQDFTGRFDDPVVLKKALEGCDAMFHLAACPSLRSRDRLECQRVNVDMVEKLVGILLSIGNIKLIYTSSVAAVGLSKMPAILDEESPFNSSDITYALTKHRSETAVKAAAQKGLFAVIVNPGTVVGPIALRESQKRFFRAAAQGTFVPCPPGGTCVTWVGDVCRGMIQAAEKGISGERYILGGHNLTFKEYISTIARAAGNKVRTINVPGFLLPSLGALAEFFLGQGGRDSGKLAARFSYYSSKKAEAALGYRITPLANIMEDMLIGLGIGKRAAWAH